MKISDNKSIIFSVKNTARVIKHMNASNGVDKEALSATIGAEK